MNNGMLSLNDDWLFTSEWSDDFATGTGGTDADGSGAGMTDDAQCEVVRLPHQPVMIPLHYATSAMLRMVCGYRRQLTVDKALLKGKNKKRLFLQFDGAAHTATVYVNGTEAATHDRGDEMFRVEITPYVHAGDDNVIAVRLDTFKERAKKGDNIVSDELTYGGLHREVWLDVRGVSYIEEVLVTTRNNDTVCLKTQIVQGETKARKMTVTVTDEEDTEIADGTFDVSETADGEVTLPLKNARIWDIQHPYLYTLTCILIDEKEKETDRKEVKFGVRDAEFRADGFYLNRKKIFLRGLNRYQGFPYIGSAATKRLLEEDARILKKDLKCNAVRIPKEAQPELFISACDRLGLLVFAEKEAPQYVNHPSVIARDKDTAAANVVNFASAQDKIIETDGKIFPTKSFDPWEKRQEQALRHARVLDDALSLGQHAGCFQWCLSDYQTYADYGSGDRVCYHGVLDIFRNPKIAAAVYAAQGDDEVILTVACPMDAGDYAAGQMGDIYCLTNADEVTLYKGDDLVKRYAPDRKRWKGLKHPPVLVDIDDEIRENGKASLWQFIATKNALTKEVTKGPGSTLHLDVRVSHARLIEEDTYDIAAVRVRLLDEHGNQASYAQLPVSFELTGDAALIGPDTATAEGGMCGTFVRSIGKSGEAQLTIRTAQTGAVKISFQTALSHPGEETQSKKEKQLKEKTA